MLKKTNALRDGRKLRLPVGDVARSATSYAALGLRIIRQTARQAVLELPCGVYLVLSATPSRAALR